MSSIFYYQYPQWLVCEAKESVNMLKAADEIRHSESEREFMMSINSTKTSLIISAVKQDIYCLPARLGPVPQRPCAQRSMKRWVSRFSGLHRSPTWTPLNTFGVNWDFSWWSHNMPMPEIANFHAPEWEQIPAARLQNLVGSTLMPMRRSADHIFLHAFGYMV